ncbi:putative NBD/HSP70 family sugar kinase [Arthrobacter sp. AG258]|uniref:ROK family transcriptional regulator n=1 Tax=Arthrobacter sp. AG258 TaxID=2183899 RepID=UPI00105F42BC|nr:ROK family transcriptional regulator [Arthrobacter sp. AG258]TDT74649.1 putative NBD/HSP70 family sugar kinase [Arthrobacter sp. AG258]
MPTAAKPPRFGARGRVLELVRSAGPTSRTELAEASGLTQAAISNIVKELLRDGLISEVGQSASTGGKPRTLLRLNPDSRLGIGVLLGAESITFVVCNLAGELVSRMKTKGAKGLTPGETVAFIVECVRFLVEDAAALDAGSIVGIGVAMPGPIDLRAGVMARVLARDTWQEWADFPLREELEKATALPVVMDNDATAAAVGEYWLGATGGVPAYACVYVAGGIGAGLVVDGTPYRGVSSNVGELGHISVNPGGALCPCGNRGCLELAASPAAVVARAELEATAGKLDMSFSGNVEEDLGRLGVLAARGDAVANSILTDAADLLAAGVLTLANLFDVGLIVLAGPAFVSTGSVYLDRIGQALRRSALARDIHPVRLHLSVSTRDSAALGAAVLVLQEQLDPRKLRSVSTSADPEPSAPVASPA